AQPTQKRQDVVREVDLPPNEALPFRGRNIVVVVVPAFSKGKQGNEEIVAAVVRSLKRTAPKAMRERVDRKRRMVEQHRAYTETPYQHLQARGMPARKGVAQPGSQPEQRPCQYGRRNRGISVQQAQLRIPSEVGDQPPLGFIKPFAKKPAHVGPPKTPPRRMRIVFRV